MTILFQIFLFLNDKFLFIFPIFLLPLAHFFLDSNSQIHQYLALISQPVKWLLSQKRTYSLCRLKISLLILMSPLGNDQFTNCWKVCLKKQLSVITRGKEKKKKSIIMPEIISTLDEINIIIKFLFPYPTDTQSLSFEFSYQTGTQVLKPHNSKPQHWISHQTSEINTVAFYT